MSCKDLFNDIENAYFTGNCYALEGLKTDGNFTSRG